MLLAASDSVSHRQSALLCCALPNSPPTMPLLLATRIQRPAALVQLATTVCCIVAIISIFPGLTEGRQHTRCQSRLSAPSLLAAAAECGRFKFPDSSKALDKSENSTQLSHRIAGGFEAEAGWFPSYVYLRLPLPNGMGKACGGTLISEQYIMTAAHCVDTTVHKIEPTDIEIYAGFISFQDYDAKYSATSICITMDNVADELLAYLDMALLRTDRKIRFNDRVQPACLPQAPLDVTQRVYTVGMGRMTDAEDSRAERLQFLEMGVSKCPPRYDRFKPNNFTICFVAPNGTPCKGDSGGPPLGIVNGRQTVFGIFSYKSIRCRKAPIIAAFADVYKAVAQLYESASKCASSQSYES